LYLHQVGFLPWYEVLSGVCDGISSSPITG